MTCALILLLLTPKPFTILLLLNPFTLRPGHLPVYHEGAAQWAGGGQVPALPAAAAVCGRGVAGPEGGASRGSGDIPPCKLHAVVLQNLFRWRAVLEACAVGRGRQTTGGRDVSSPVVATQGSVLFWHLCIRHQRPGSWLGSFWEHICIPSQCSFCAALVRAAGGQGRVPV